MVDLKQPITAPLGSISGGLEFENAMRAARLNLLIKKDCTEVQSLLFVLGVNRQRVYQRVQGLMPSRLLYQ